MRKVETDLSRLDEVIAKQYEDKIRGLAKDSIQNSWAARKSKRGRDFRVVFRFYRNLGNEENVMLIEDSGTLGMGEVEWEAFHAHWKSTKVGYETGRVSRWGQGKTLFLYFSETNRILTESVDDQGRYRYSARTNIGFLQLGDTPEPGDPEWIKNPDGTLKQITHFFPSVRPLDHQGTRVWILNVKDELAEEVRAGRLVEQLSESWWEIILKYGAKLECEEVASPVVRSIQVPLPQLPMSEHEFASDPKEPISVSNGAGILVLKLVLTKGDVKESLRGIAIQRGGMTVTRYDSQSVPPDFKTRLYGYCIPDNSLDLELYNIEMANHEGFEPRKSVWVHLRRRIDEEIEKFLAPHIRKVSEPELDIDQEDIVNIVNKIVGDYLEGSGPEIRKRTVRFEPWAYKGTDRRFELDEILEHNAAVRNSTDKVVKVTVKRWVRGGGDHLAYQTDQIKIPKNRSWRLALPEIDFKKVGLAKGEYALKGRLVRDDGTTLHERGVKFYLGVDPPPPQPFPTIEAGEGHTWLKRFIIGSIEDKEQKRYRNLPYNGKDQSVFINKEYREFVEIRKGRFKKSELSKRLKHYVVNVLLAEAAKEWLMQVYEKEEHEFGMEEIRSGKELFDKMWYDFVEQYGIV